jgi:FlaA1/EpsC-like NDP-sugar epimerase
MYLSTLEDFINKHIVNRPRSLFNEDIASNQNALSKQIKNKSFLVIGGAGTIGSSYIKSILPFLPKKITIIDYNENGLAEIIRDLRSTPDLLLPQEIITYPFDFGSPLLEKLLEKEHFDVIACFAAHKHVRSEKDILAVESMFNNNVFNTKRLLDLVINHQPEHVFAVSTDKAANPVNIMGGSKKLMENIIMAYSSYVNVTTARFANVAFSNGSLLYGFNNRIVNGQPLSAPNDILRYFVTPAESGQICMLASLLGESSEIFFPKLAKSEMKSFSEIADSFLSELGYKPDYCSSEQEAKEKASHWTPDNKYYPVYYFKSDTTGEKSYEEFYTENEKLDLNKFNALGIIKNSKTPSLEEVNIQVEELKQAFAQKNSVKEDIVNLLKKYIPDFGHVETGKNLDSKM